MKNLLKIEDLRKELYTGKYGDCICNYDNGYICDIITEIADSHVDIYINDLLDWAKNNYSYIEEALDEFGTPTDSKRNADFIKIIMQGQYLYNERDLYDNLEDSLKLFAYVYIQNVLSIEEITEEQNENLLNYDYTDNNDKLEYIIDYINDIFNNQD